MSNGIIKKIHQWKGTNSNVIYHIILPDLTIPFNAEIKKDKIGSLYCVECSVTGYFEEYGLIAVKNKIVAKLLNR